MMADLYYRIREEDRRDEAMQMWLVQFHFMVSGQMKYTSFTDFYDQISGRNIDLRSDSDILAEVEEIRKYV